MSDDLLITPGSRKLEIKDTSGNVDAKIETDASGNLLITNAGGDISIGDTSSDVFIGDGTNNVDIVFEQNGEIRGTSGVTLTLGASGSSVAMATDLSLGGNDLTNVGDITVTGNLTVNGTTTTIDSTNTVIEDSIIELNSGLTGANSKDIGFIFERGTTGNNAGFVWDESADRFTVFTTTDTAASDTVNTSAVANFQAGSFFGNGANLTSLNADNLGSGTVPTGRLGNALLRSGGTMTGSIAMANYNITGVNQLEFNDPGEGIVFKSGSSGDMVLKIIDDASDNILQYSGTNAVFDVQGTITTDGLTSVGASTFNAEGGVNVFYSHHATSNADDWQVSPISIRERGLNSNNSTNNEYSPNLNFHWGSVVSRSLTMTSDGNFTLGEWTSSGTPSMTSSLSFLNTGGYKVNNTVVIDASRNVILGSNLYFGATDSSLLAKDGVNIKYMADGIHKFETYAGAWVQRAQIDDDGLDVTGNITATGNITITGDGFFNGTKLEGDSKEMIRFSDTWLRINPAGEFTSGIYLGNGIVRTDGQFQVGSSGSEFKIESNGTTTVAGNVTITGGNTDGSGNAFVVNRGGNTQQQALRIQNSGEVVVSANYLYAAHTGTSFYSQGDAVIRGNLRNDSNSGADPLTVSDKLNVTGDIQSNGTVILTATGRNLTNIGTISSGNITLSASGSKIILDAYDTSQEGGGIFFREGFHNSNKYNLSIMARSRSNDGSADGLSINAYEGITFSTGSNSYNERLYLHSTAAFTVPISTTGAISGTSLDTGQGANELYAMNQNVRTTDSPTFGGLTLTGKLTLPDAGITVADSYHSWKRNYVVNSSSPQEILYNDGTSLDVGGVYRFTAHIAGTGTDQNATAVFWNQNGTWRVNVTGQSGTSSNHPEFIISSSTNKPTIHIDHTSNYTVHIYHEWLQLSEQLTGTDNAGYAFGTDAFLGSVGDKLYFTPNGTTATGANPYDDGDEVYHEGHKPTYSELGTMAYSNLTGTPTIPTNNNQLTNGASYITASNSAITNKMPLAGGTFTGGTTYNNVSGNAITISSESPQIRFNDTTSGADDFWIHVNSDRFYILADRGDDGSWETPYPLELNASSNIGYIFAQRAFTEAYHPNADKWTTARTLSLSGDASGSVSWDGSANATLSVAVSNDSHTHAFNNLTGKTSGTGEYSTSGYLTAGRGTGGVSLTHNDGYGNANVTFNHKAGVPEQAGNCGRIVVNTDSTTSAKMTFELLSNSGTSAVNTPSAMELTESGMYIPEYLYHLQDTDTYLRLQTDRIRIYAGGTPKFDSNNTYLTSHQDISGKVDIGSGFSDNRVLTAANSDTAQGEANLTFNGSTLAVTGAISVTGPSSLIQTSTNGQQTALRVHNSTGTGGYFNVSSNVGGVNTDGNVGLHVGWNKSNGGREINMIFDGGTTQADTEMIFTSTDGSTYTDIFQINGGGNVDIKSGGLRIGTTTVIDSGRRFYPVNIQSSGTISFLNGSNGSSGSGAQGINVRHIYAGTSYASSTAGAGQIEASSGFKVAGTQFIDSSRNLTNIGTINSGQITASKIHAGSESSSFTDGTDPDISTDNIFATEKVVSPKIVWLNDASGDDNYATCNDNNNTYTVKGNQSGAWWEWYGDKTLAHAGHRFDYWKGKGAELTGFIQFTGTGTGTEDGGYIYFGNATTYKINPNQQSVFAPGATTNSTTRKGIKFTHGMGPEPVIWYHATGTGAGMLKIYTTQSGVGDMFALDATNGNGHFKGDVTAFSTTTTSDIKLKENVRDLEGALDTTLKLRGVKFDWKDENKDNDQLGFIAQEVEEVLPEIVKEVTSLGENDETHKSVNYSAVVPILVEAIKEQQTIINRLEERISNLENNGEE